MLNTTVNNTHQFFASLTAKEANDDTSLLYVIHKSLLVF